MESASVELREAERGIALEVVRTAVTRPAEVARSTWQGAGADLVVLARGGVVHGASDKLAAYSKDGRITPQELHATVDHRLGIPRDAEIQNALGHPLAVYRVEHVRQVLGWRGLAKMARRKVLRAEQSREWESSESRGESGFPPPAGRVFRSGKVFTPGPGQLRHGPTRNYGFGRVCAAVGRLARRVH